MSELKIASTHNTPEITFDRKANEFWIKGLSKPEEPLDFYTPVLEWLQNMDAPTEQVAFNFKLDYFNSSSNKLILELLRVLDAKGNVEVLWHYDKMDEAMLDAAEDYMEQVDLPIKLLPYEDQG